MPIAFTGSVLTLGCSASTSASSVRAFTREFNELRSEVRFETAGCVVLWPKLDGTNVLASDTPGENAFTIFNESGTSVDGPTNILPTLDNGVSKFVVPVSAAVASRLVEDYTVRVTYKRPGDTKEYLVVRQFDIVRWPLQPSVSLHDMSEELSDAPRICGRIAEQLGQADDRAGREYVASICAVRAIVELDSLIRVAIHEQRGRVLGATFTGPARSRDNPYTRPNLIINRERYARVERKFAMAALMEMNGGSEDGDDPVSLRFRSFRSQAITRWTSIGPMKYDIDENLTTNHVLEDIGSSVRLVRG